MTGTEIACVKRLVFQSFPNNEVRVGLDDLPYPVRRGGDLTAQKEAERKGREHDEARLQWLRDNNIFEFRDSHGTLYRTEERNGVDVCDEFRANLVITSEVQETSRSSLVRGKPDYSKPVGYTRFTRNARHRLLEAGSICEERRREGSTGLFVTFTLPGSTWAAYDAISRYSGYIANRICQCIRDHQYAESYFWVYERQKRGALHLHLFVGLRPGIPWDCYRDALRSCWYSSLCSVGESSGVDMFRHADGLYCTASSFWRYDYQEVTKGVGNYLSKYVSKQAESGMGEGVEKGDARLFPRRWWYMSRNLTQEINRRRKTICVEGVRDEDAQLILHCMDAMATSLEPVLSHEYNADIGRTKYRDGSFGSSYRAIKWYPCNDFADIELCLRTHFLSLVSEIRKTRVTWKGFALDYGGERLPIPGS